MAGEINFFRKRFLGGFDKQDVVDYIAGQADERNKLTDEIEKVRLEHESLIEEIRTERKTLVEETRLERETLIEETRLERESMIEKAKSDRETLIEEARLERGTLKENARLEREAFEAERQTLNAEIESLKKERDEIRKQAREYKVASLVSAANVLEDVKKSLEGYQNVVEASVSRARDEFKLAADTVATLPAIFEKTGDTVGALIGQINEECDNIKYNDVLNEDDISVKESSFEQNGVL